MLFRRLSLIPVLATAVALSSCSMLGGSDDSTEFAAPFTTVNAKDDAGNSDADGDAEPDAAESTKTKDGRNPEDFAVDEATMDTFGVKTAGLECFIQPPGDDNDVLISCDFEFNDPPLMPALDNPEYQSNSVAYRSGYGFKPAVRLGGEPIPMVDLEAGESVDIEGITVEAESDTKATVTYKGHHFTYDGGEYYSDTFPPTKDDYGYADRGVVCGEYIHPGGDRGYIYVVEDGTNCDTAKTVLADYKESDAYADREAATIDGWDCRYHRLPAWSDKKDPRLGCSSDEGYFMVFIPAR